MTPGRRWRPAVAGLVAAVALGTAAGAAWVSRALRTPFSAWDGPFVDVVLEPGLNAGAMVERLVDAGVPIVLSTGHPSRSIRFLALEASLAVRAGLDEGTALRAITLNAAAALGLADRIGSIEPGKEADLAIFDGDPLLPASRVTHTLVGGRVVYEV